MAQRGAGLLRVRAPDRYVKQLRLEHAKVVLESTDEPLKRVAFSSGFGSVDALQRCLRSHPGAAFTVPGTKPKMRPRTRGTALPPLWSTDKRSRRGFKLALSHSVDPHDRSGIRADQSSQTPVRKGPTPRNSCHRGHPVFEPPRKFTMNDTKQPTPCTCKSCPGTSCTCGCQRNTTQATCACGPQCQCGPGCTCTKS